MHQYLYSPHGRLASLLCAVLLLAGASAGAQELARSGMYAGFELGTVIPGEWDTDGMDNDVLTACDDHLFDTSQLDPADCGSGDLWTNEIEFDAGILGGLQLGWFHNRFRFELEYAYSDLGGDRGGINELIAGKESEFQYENEKFENISSHDLFLNAYMDFPARRGFTTYLGVGIGWRQMELDYTGTFMRNTDSFFADPANNLSGIREAAGTITRIEKELDDDMFGYQFIVGADYAIDERLTLGAKLRYARFEDFDGGSHEYDYLRSHDSNTSPGAGQPGRDPGYPAELDRTVRNKIEIDDVDNWAVSLNLKYAFGGSRGAAPRGAAAGDERSGMYMGFDLGLAFPEEFDTTESDNDVATLCDTYFTFTSGTRPTNCGTGDTWSVGFDPDTGILGGVHVGWLHGNWRTEIEYFYQAAGGESNPIPLAGLPASKEQEIILTSEAIDNITGHNLFANLYYDFVNDSRFTPYVGVGVGWQRMEFDHDIAFVRNTRAVLEMTAPDRKEAAGTITRVEQKLDDDMFGYQLIAGADYALTDHLAVGAKLRYTRFDEFDGGSYEYDELRSHPSRTGPPSDPNSRPVRATFETDEIETWGASLSVKYLF